MSTDLRRQAWAMGVAAIDTYLHWVVHRVDLGKPLPKDLRKLEVSFEDLLAMGQASVDARKANRRDRPQVRARNVLHRRILTDTYQSSRGVETALRMAGVRDCWGQLSRTLSEPKQDLMDHLNMLSQRRNSIVHEGDIKRMSRPRALKHQELDAAEVLKQLDWIRSFLGALDALTQ
ncbi:hypothetical protein [Cellulosimicrobium funkei]|uniref:RiboL-PSP-HEPN domain-containing protein n=1 Tax=Cellulosimicrobium funkei TaxID=264251 RepID=A0A4Y8R3A0_9MICO|nr:hypothetical protein [Cellulosimicrobium funkei]TFF10546.1 hypothetical protein E1O70_12265 [Cellulosimicrobium funkei]TGA73561.1 hypothetical protein EQW79_009565 [Cellulosimicrobium terreum]